MLPLHRNPEPDCHQHHSCRIQLDMHVRLTHICMTFHGTCVNLGTYVQCQWIEGAVSQGLGEEQLQG